MAFFREKKIISGAILEIYQERCSPSGKVRNRTARNGETSEAQAAINFENAKKRLMRLMNANFTAGDLLITLCYASEPSNEEISYKLLSDFLRKLRKVYAKKTGKSLKYITVTEKGDKFGRLHHHIVCKSFEVSPAELLSLWGKGRVDISTLDGDPYYEWLMVYLEKQKRTCKRKKRWGQSKHLTKPTEPPEKVIKRKELRKAVKAPKGYYVMNYRHYADSYGERRYIICIKQDRKNDIPQWLLEQIEQLPENCS